MSTELRDVFVHLSTQGAAYLDHRGDLRTRPAKWAHALPEPVFLTEIDTILMLDTAFEQMSYPFSGIIEYYIPTVERSA